MFKSSLVNLSLFLVVIFILSFSTSCRKDLDFQSHQNVNLQFSKDTIFLDTIFTQSNSETYLLKVYNPSNDDISLSQVYLNQRENSAFRINLDGMPGFEFFEVPLRAKDSLMVFVEVAVGDFNSQMIEEDELVFSDSQQSVKLLAMIEEARYYYPENGEDFIYFNENETWENDISHVVYGLLKVDNADLNIEAGAKVYFHQNSGIIIENGGVLNLNGTLENPILLRGSRHDARYDSLPKQWNQIQLIDASLNANYAIVKGGVNGFHLENSTANIENTQIYNMSSSGIFAKNSEIIGKNLVISDAGDAGLNIENGGNYTFYYTSIATQWRTGLAGINGPNIPVYLSNTSVDENGNESFHDLNASFINSIFYGRYANAVYLDKNDEADFQYSFLHCLLKNENPSEIDYLNDSNFVQPIIESPLFISTIFSQQDLRLEDDSPARNAANSSFNHHAPTDIQGITRDSSPNLGAYE